MTSAATSDVTVGIDIGTTSVKALAVAGDGEVLARTRIPHELVIPSPGRFEHDAAAWRTGPRRALAELGVDDVAGVSVAAMVPSLTAVDDSGSPIAPGLLYGDERGDTGSTLSPAESGELVAFLRWLAEAAPDAAGYWPAQAVANHALCGEAILDTVTAATALPLFDWIGWDEAVAAEAGTTVDRLPRIAPTGTDVARVDGNGPVLAPGCIDAFAEQLVAGANSVGDVLVILGTTLIVWVVVDEPLEVEGCFTVPHTVPGLHLVGGPSNAGGLFADWVARTTAAPDGAAPDPGDVPVWAPYLRGERVPLHDPTRRAVVSGLDLTHGPAALRRAAFEASGFATRRIIELAGGANRIIATGGGIRVPEWTRALADTTGLPVDSVAVPEGGAYGSAFLARVAAGLEGDGTMLDAARWARTGSRTEPDARWVEPAADRYSRFLEL